MSYFKIITNEDRTFIFDMSGSSDDLIEAIIKSMQDDENAAMLLKEAVNRYNEITGTISCMVCVN